MVVFTKARLTSKKVLLPVVAFQAPPSPDATPPTELILLCRVTHFTKLDLLDAQQWIRPGVNVEVSGQYLGVHTLSYPYRVVDTIGLLEPPEAPDEDRQFLVKLTLGEAPLGPAQQSPATHKLDPLQHLLNLPPAPADGNRRHHSRSNPGYRGFTS
jgi:hypothetical protein